MGVVTCSALRKIYRQVILWGGSAIGQDSAATPHPALNITDDQSLGAVMGGADPAGGGPEGCAQNVVFVCLRATRPVLQQRLSSRTAHFLSPSLLDSQLETLEEPGGEEQHITVDTDGRCVSDVVLEVEERLRHRFGLSPDL